MKRFSALIIALIYSITTFAESPKIENPSTPLRRILDIPLNLSAKDKRSGFQLSPKFIVTPIRGGEALPLKTANGETIVTAKVGESYKIRAELDGYAPLERTIEITQNDYPEGRNVVLDLEPQPSAVVVFKTVDSENENEIIESVIKVTVKDKVYNGRITKANPTYRFILTSTDQYTVEVTSNTHKTKKEVFPFEIGDPPRTYNKTIALSKPDAGTKILVYGEDTNKPLKGANITITNTTDKALVMDNLLPEAEAFVETMPNKKYTAKVSYGGYVTREFTLNTNAKEQILKLQPETYLSLGAFDGLLNKRLPATFKIYFKGNKVFEITGDANSDIRFKPAEKGIYEYEITYPNYKPYKNEANIENLQAGKIQYKAPLESTVDTYVILIEDALTKEFIPAAKLTMMSAEGVLVPVKYNNKTGEWKVELEKEKEYKLSIEAPEFQPINETFARGTSKLIKKSLSKVTQSLYFTAVDALTKMPISTQYKVIRPDQEPLIGTSEAGKPYKVELFPQSKFIIEAKAEGGYTTFTDNLSFKSEIKDPNRVIELVKDIYSFKFIVTNTETSKNHTTAKVTLLNTSTGQPVTPSSNANGIFEADVNPNNNYSIEIEAEGFEKHKSNPNVKNEIMSNKFEINIPLYKSAVSQFKLTVVNDVDGKNVLNADLRVFNAKNQPMPIMANPMAQEWNAELRNDENYTVEVKAEGYLAYKNNLSKNTKNIVVRIKPIPSQEISISAVDALTKKPIVAEFKLTSGNETINGTVTSGGTKLKTKLLEDRNYQLEITSAGYKPYKDVVKLQSAVNSEIPIEIKKEFYTFGIKGLDSKSKKPVANVKFSVINESDKSNLTGKFDQVANTYSADLLTDNNYIVEVEAAGYEKQTEKIDVNAAAKNSDFKKDVLLNLIPKKEPEKKEPETKNIEVKVTNPEPPKKEEKLVVTPPVVTKVEEKPPVEKPKPTPPAPKRVEKTVVDDAIVIEENDLSVKVEVYENLAIGKKFRLGSVFFVQSSAELKPQSYPQLDKLIRTLKLNPKYKIEITGHTDNVGDARQNLYLSELRARKIANYIFNGGIAQDRIRYVGKGQEEPISSNDTEDNRSKNRRVEFVVRDSW
ncbi:MAG: OmpA family protein [Spirosomataceae bacterium]